MDRTRIICHILQSLDGNIDGAFFSAPETRPALQEYGRIRAELRCDAVVSGATTAAEIYADGLADVLPETGEKLPRVDWQAGRGECYAVVIDGTGTVRWTGGTVRRGGREMRVVAVLQEDVADGYLALLRQAGVSYLFAGRDRLDLRLAVEKLRARFGIRTMLLAGGGVVDWAFLQAGLVDEISLVLPPVVDGGVGLASAFDASALCQGAPMAFALKDVRRLQGDALWLRYEKRER